jgi:diacylglycerol O-acyltransferase
MVQAFLRANPHPSRRLGNIGSMLERLSALDASFLLIEKRNRPMHVGALFLLEPGPDGFDRSRMKELIRERLHLVPRYRQKVRSVPGHIANPVWVDDPNFDLDYHLQHRSLPKPGRREQLWDLAGRLFSRSLDRSRPLWEGYLIDGLEDGQVALVLKTHHCMVDGVSAVEMITTLVDPTAEPRRIEAPPWRPDPEPSNADLLKSGILDQVGQPLQVAVAMKDWASDLSTTAKRSAGTAVGLASTGRKMAGSLAKTPLETPSTEWRRYRAVSHRLEDYKTVKNQLGGTINDAVLAVVTGALRSWLLNRGVDMATDATVRIMAPASMRKPEQMGSGGNLVSAMFVDVPVGQPAAVLRYRAIQEQTKRIKATGEAVAAGALMPAADFIAPNLFAIAVRSAMHTDFLHTVVTNVPGPQLPLYVNGAEITEMFPFLTTVPGRTLTHGVLSYNGKMCWGLIGERDGMYDLAAYADFLDASLDELLELAAAEG